MSGSGIIGTLPTLIGESGLIKMGVKKWTDFVKMGGGVLLVLII